MSNIRSLPKKPSRPPPAPPGPPVQPRDASLATSYNSLNYLNSQYTHYNRAGSECCSEFGPQSAIISCTAASLQTRGYNNSSTQSEYGYLSTMSECYCSCRNSRHFQHPRYPQTYQESYSTSGYNSDRSFPLKPVAPVPLERKKNPRPRLSISPMPELKRTTASKQSRYRVKCTPLRYKRLIEQHIERIFKYLKDRQKHIDQFESDVNRNPELEKLRHLLVQKETRYLRSLRIPMSSNNFTRVAKLGSGYMGNVWLVEKAGTGELYAMKLIKKSQVFRENHIAHIMAERDILAEAENDWIVKLFYSFQDDLYLYFILEYIPGGDLMNLLYDKNVFPEDWARFYIAEISLALQFVHDKNFVHRDVKPDNILIDRKGHIKLTDFGLCTGFRWTHDKNFYSEDSIDSQDISHDEHPTITKALARRESEYSKRAKKISVVGSPNYIAPEVLDQDRRETTNEKLCDWWSVGVILYEMVIGYCPFIDLRSLKTGEYDARKDPPEQIQMRIVNWREYLAFPSPDDPNSPPLMCETGKDSPYWISNETKSLIQGWICDPGDRLCGKNGIRDIQFHPFFRGIDWNNIRNMEAPFKPVLTHKKDTSHFDPQSSDGDNTLGASNHHEMAKWINDFTYRSFWDKPENR